MLLLPPLGTLVAAFIPGLYTPAAEVATVEVVLHVEAEGTERPVGSEPDARLFACRTESPMPWWGAKLQAVPRDGFPVAIGGQHGLRVPVDQDLGFAAYSTARGYTEVVIPKGTWADAAATGTPVALTLTLPKLSQPGKLRLVESFPQGTRRRFETHTIVMLPRTGIMIAPFEPRSRVGERAHSLPPGTYRVQSTPFEGRFCAMDPLEPAPAAGIYETFTVVEGATTTLEHEYVRGHTLNVKFSVPPTATAEEALSRRKELEETMIFLKGSWWLDDQAHRSDHWYVVADLQRKDLKTGELGERFPLSWGWSWVWGATVNEQPRVPFDQDVYSLARFPAGDYVLTVRGPKTVTKSVAIQIPPPADSSERETISLELKSAGSSRRR